MKLFVEGFIPVKTLMDKVLILRNLAIDIIYSAITLFVWVACGTTWTGS